MADQSFVSLCVSVCLCVRVCVRACVGACARACVTFSRARAYTLYCATPVLTIREIK